MKIKKWIISGAIAICLILSSSGFSADRPDDTGLEARIKTLRQSFPSYFLPDAVIRVADDLERPTVYGEPDPPEGFAGPDPAGRHPFGIYIPRGEAEYFQGDISIEQWIIHEMFHLRNRRAHEYDRFITLAFPDESDPLVQWIRKDPYHRTFAKEEAFINLITFADPARTAAQKQAVREWYDRIGARDRSLAEIRKTLRVVRH